ncbi:MAG: CCA tRNA nucleotidyltransferase [Dehalococcoidales bacterium]|nr:CCA tRNA nucleotidyltransferase [Dehalococcoidales bacterium]
MTETINLSAKIEEKLPAELVDFMRQAGEAATARGQKLYLVGGVVRDLLLGRANLDLDLVLEGDAISLAEQLAGTGGRRLKTHPRFGTAKVQWQRWSVDLTTARSETYDKPGALPKVKPGSLADDLFRRDFTINAMAVELAPGSYGHLIDPYRGLDDLGSKLVRILHPVSFIDDSTRIWRGLRYEQRLDFHLEADTLRLLKRDVPMLDTISGDRLRHELEMVLREERPEKVLRRAGELGVLSQLYPGLTGDDWLAEKYADARTAGSSSVEVYLALLAYRLTGEETEGLISRLRLPNPLARTLRETVSLKARLPLLADAKIAPSRIYRLLEGNSLPAITASLLAADSAVARQHIRLYLDRLRYVRPTLTGRDLQQMGIAPGPRMKEILERLHEARLDGKVTSKKGEEEMVRGWIF